MVLLICVTSIAGVELFVGAGFAFVGCDPKPAPPPRVFPPLREFPLQHSQYAMTTVCIDTYNDDGVEVGALLL